MTIRILNEQGQPLGPGDVVDLKYCVTQYGQPDRKQANLTIDSQGSVQLASVLDQLGLEPTIEVY